MRRWSPYVWLAAACGALILAGTGQGCAGRDYGPPSGIVKLADKPAIWCNDTKQGVGLYRVPPAPCPDLSDVEGSIRDSLWRSIAKKSDLEGLRIVFVDHKIICGKVDLNGKRSPRVTTDQAGNLHQFWWDDFGLRHDGYDGCYSFKAETAWVHIRGRYNHGMEYSVRHETCHHIEPNLPHKPRKRCFVESLIRTMR